MAIVDWRLPGTSGDWSSTTLWAGLDGGEIYPGKSPILGDNVTIGGTNGAYVVTFDVPTATISSLDIAGGKGANSVTTLRMLAGNTLNILGPVTLLKQDSPAAIDGAGTISISGAFSAFGPTGSEGTVTAGTATTGGVLELTGTGFITTPFVFAIGTAAPTTLAFNLEGGVLSPHAVTINDVDQTLQIGPLTRVVIQVAQNVTNGTILMSGGTLTDTSGISFGTNASSGSMRGFGTVNGPLTRSGTGTANSITASGGTLVLTGTFGAGLVAVIDTVPNSTLKFDNVATLLAPIAITSVNQTLEIGSSGVVIIGADQNVTLGTIKLEGGTLIDLGLGGISFGTNASSGSLSGFGNVVADQLTRSGSGTANTITANGGTLTLVTTIGDSSGLVFNIGNSAVSSLQLITDPGDNTFAFEGSEGELALIGVAASGFNDEIVGLNVGSTLTPTNSVHILGDPTITVTSPPSGSGTTATVELSNGATLHLSSITGAAGNWFVQTASDGAGGTEVFLSVVCYVAGTGILTDTGERAIESLSPGEIVLTLSDGQLSERPVTWLGHRRIDLTRHPEPEKVAPIRIERDAIAEGIPHRDLLVSPDHAILVDGLLICARQLVNNTTIRRERDWMAVDYYHVELDQHAILLAEGLPAESYLDTGNSGFFANADAPLVLHPDLTDETNHPTREVGSCAPFVWDEASVRPVWQRLMNRAAALGRPGSQRVTTTDADLRLIANGRTVNPVYGDSERVIFVLPRGAEEVRLVSRAQPPTEARPWLGDQRRLGVRVKRIVLRGANELREVPMDHPDIAQGWWAIERDGPMMSRWTDGEAVLPLPTMSGHDLLEVQLAGSMIYVMDAAPEGETKRRAAA